MKTKHTPGPWQMMGKGIVHHPVSGRQLITDRIETPLGFIEVLDSTNEPEYNAKLIASAPELLEALKSAKLALRYSYSPKFSEAEVLSLCPAYQSATDAIAKATE